MKNSLISLAVLCVVANAFAESIATPSANHPFNVETTAADAPAQGLTTPSTPAVVALPLHPAPLRKRSQPPRT